MRILTAQEFIKEPCGTVYIHYESHTFIGQPKIKNRSKGEKDDSSWWLINVLPWIKGDNNTEIEEELDEWDRNHSYELITEGFYDNDTIYNHDDNMLYAVFNKEEVKCMINRLIESFYESDKYNK